MDWKNSIRSIPPDYVICFHVNANYCDLNPNSIGHFVWIFGVDLRIETNWKSISHSNLCGLIPYSIATCGLIPIELRFIQIEFWADIWIETNWNSDFYPFRNSLHWRINIFRIQKYIQNLQQCWLMLFFDRFKLNTLHF